jgi:glycogen synthase
MAGAAALSHSSIRPEYALTIMHLLLLTSELPPENAGGIARYVENMAQAMSAQGHQVTIIVRADQPDLFATSHQHLPGVRVIPILPGYTKHHLPSHSPYPDQHPSYPYNTIGDWPGVSYQIAEQVLDLLKHEPAPDIIESQEFGALPYYLLQRKLTERGPLERIPIVVHRHTALFEIMQINQEPRYKFPEYWVGQMEKFCIRAADALLSPSRFLADQTRPQYGQDLAITTIPLPMAGVNSAKIIPTPHAAQTDSDLPNLLAIGRLEVRKGILPMLAACERLWQAGTHFRLTMIGGDTHFRPRGQMMSEFIRKRYARWIKQGQLVLAGAIPQVQVLEQIQQAWAVLVPSIWENFPNTCIEAMAAGKVVLASRSGGQAEMIESHGNNGLLFDWEKPADFEQQLHHLLELSESERSAMGRHAAQRIQHLCDPEQIVHQRITHFEQVIEHHSARRIFPSMLEKQLPVLAAQPEIEQSDLLSVVIPFYNLGAYIEETVQSILASSYRPLEIVLVDDGSTDQASIYVVDQLAAQHPEMRAIRIANAGLANARNVGAEAARGELLAFLDADDTIEPQYYAAAIDVLRRYDNVAFVYSWVRWFGQTNEIWPTWNAEFPYLLGHNMLAPIVVLRRRQYCQFALSKPSMAYNFEDYEVWLNLAQAGGVGVSLPYPYANYRVRPESMYRGANQDQQWYLFELLSKFHPELYQRWGTELFHLQNANGPAYLWNHPAIETNPDTAQIQQIRTAESQGIWISDMLRAGRIMAWLRRSWMARFVRRIGLISLIRTWLQREH